MLALIAHIIIVIACTFRILLRPHREPVSRMAWLVVVLAIPFVGAVGYLLLGDTNIGRTRVARLKEITANLPRVEDMPGWNAAENVPKFPDEYEALFKVGKSISGHAPVGGNQASLLKDSDAAIDAMVADIDQATDHVHLLFYIWLADSNGTKMAEALKRAAARGVTCRAMVDDLGSRALVKSQLWKDMGNAGVHTERALVVGNPLVRIFNGRIDLRNHRKILVIDNSITYCGSQNCADAAFLPKAKYAPWVDAVMRFTGPVVRQNQHLFAADWMANCSEDISDVLRQP